MPSFLTTAFTLSLGVYSAHGDKETAANKPKTKSAPSCDLYLAPLKTQRENGFRTGIYAGRDFRQSELLEVSSSLLMKSAVIEEWQLYDYSFETESKDYEMHLFGSPAIIAHREHGNVHHFWTQEENTDIPLVPPNPYTDFDTVSFYAETRIAQGEELLLSNGDMDIDLDAEEESLGIEYGEDDFAPHTIAELRRVGHCLSNVYVDESTISQAHDGLFTKNTVKKGDIVTISPMMVLPRHKVEKQNDNSLLINYCISRNDSDVALLPVGLAGMINHNNGDYGDVANLHMEWHSWDSPSGKTKVKWETKPLEAAEFPPLYVKYVADRDIYAGEELTISYGSDWEAAWKEFDAASRAVECSADSREESVEPQFRHYITAPEGFFPENFVSTCIGKNRNDCPYLEAKHKMSLNEELQDKYNRGPQMAAAYREKIYNREKVPSDEPNFCKQSKKVIPLVFSEKNPPLIPTDDAADEV
mmetsp:Transcript_6974/g.13328  ORF Transcript_6974/g.13328 Transcript_6974/m.13328 type:complete len:473 (+) Transcript_6974:61-1479(+)